MTGLTHTPWIVADDVEHGCCWSSCVRDSKGMMVAECDDDIARLIAAAPDLLAALILAQPCVEDASDSASPADQEFIRAAIAKAAGSADA